MSKINVFSRKGEVNATEMFFGIIFFLAAFVKFGVFSVSVFGEQLYPYSGMLMVASLFLGYISGETKKLSDWVDYDYFLIIILIALVILISVSNTFANLVLGNYLWGVLAALACVLAYYSLSIRGG